MTPFLRVAGNNLPFIIMTLQNDFRPETRSLINLLLAAGYTIRSAHDGQESFKFTDVDSIVEVLTSVDESSLYVAPPNGRLILWLFLVFGNSPGELVCDCTDNEGLDAITALHYAAWSGKPQPTIAAE